jgi:hypothetical protein
VPKHVTTYDELRETVIEAKDALIELVEGDVPDFKDSEKTIARCLRVLENAKPKKEKKK